ncbi:MAG: hypothetical protein ACRDS9_00375 [Pseudonocardiaceae bacterium]
MGVAAAQQAQPPAQRDVDALLVGGRNAFLVDALLQRGGRRARRDRGSVPYVAEPTGARAGRPLAGS